MAYSSSRWRLQEADPDGILSVSELNQQIKSLLEREFPPLWIRGEISNLRRQHSGHTYFSLKDSGGQISAVLFRGNAEQIEIDLKDGQEILALGEISVYEPRGTYQLIVRYAVDSGEGRLQAEYERLKRRLSAEGLFDRERKQPLPALPRRIALISSATGAAAKDFLRILQRRKWDGTVSLLPVLVQGQGAAPDIAETIDWANQSNRFDLIVVTRGGGSLEDLWAFNEEQTIRAIAASKLPTISAVGHEIDTTLADLAADYRAETPSGAAETISSLFISWANGVSEANRRLRELFNSQRETMFNRLKSLRLKLQNHAPEQKIENAFLRLDDMHNRLDNKLRETLQVQTQNLTGKHHRLLNRNPENQIAYELKRLPALARNLDQLLDYGIEKRKSQLGQRLSTLESLDVQKVLRKGFSLVLDQQGRILTGVNKLQPKQQITLRMQDGEAEAVIKELAQ